VPPSHWADTVTRFAEEHYPLLFGAGRELVSKIAKGLPELALEAFWDFRGTTEQRDIDAMCVELWASELWAAIVAVRALRKAHDRVASRIARREIEERLGRGWMLAGTVVDTLSASSDGSPLWRVNWIADEDATPNHSASSVIVDLWGLRATGARRMSYRHREWRAREWSATAPLAIWAGEPGRQEERTPPGNAEEHKSMPPPPPPAPWEDLDTFYFTEPLHCENHAGWPTPDNVSASPPDPVFVGPKGSDTAPAGNRGPHGSKVNPFATIQAALGVAQPGTTIRVLPGDYFCTSATAQILKWPKVEATTIEKNGEVMIAACVRVTKSGSPGKPIRIVSDTQHKARIRFVVSPSDMVPSVIWAANKTMNQVATVTRNAVNFHIYGFLLNADVCHVEIEGFHISCVQRAVVIGSRCANVRLKGLLIERLGTARLARAPIVATWFAKKGFPNPASLTYQQLTTTLGLNPKEWINPHVGIDIRASAAYVHIDGCIIRHLGPYASGAGESLPPASAIGCQPGSPPDCAGPLWHHAFNHSHGIYAQGFGITVENSTFYDISQGHNIKIDGNTLARGRPDKVLGVAFNDGFGESSHVIQACCFGPDTNPSISVALVTMYVNSYTVAFVNSKGKKESATVQLNSPKNVYVARNTFYLSEQYGAGALTQAPIWISQFPWKGTKGLVMTDNATPGQFLLALRLPCNTNTNNGTVTCTKVGSGASPGGYIAESNLHGGDLQAIINSPTFKSSVLGAVGQQVPTPSTRQRLIQALGSSGTYLFVNDGIVALFEYAKNKPMPMGEWPPWWPPTVKANHFGVPIPAQFNCLDAAHVKKLETFKPSPKIDACSENLTPP